MLPHGPIALLQAGPQALRLPAGPQALRLPAGPPAQGGQVLYGSPGSEGKTAAIGSRIHTNKLQKRLLDALHLIPDMASKLAVPVSHLREEGRESGQCLLAGFVGPGREYLED